MLELTFDDGSSDHQINQSLCSMFVDATKAREQELDSFLKSDVPIKFDWENRWLKGEEYAHILQRIEKYC